MSFSDELIINACCDLAWGAQTLALPNPSVGAIIINEYGDIVGSGTHLLAGTPHAEILAMKEAYYRITSDKRILNLTQSSALHTFLATNHNDIFRKCHLFVSLEPCNHTGKTPPCAELIANLGFARVCIGTKDNNALASGGIKRIRESGIEVKMLDSIKSRQTLLPFEILRKKRRFVLFKIAQRLDGDKSGNVSKTQSRIFTHNQRSVAQMICISGKTLLSDKPKLNSRYAIAPFSADVSPNIGIITKQNQALIEKNAQYLCENTNKNCKNTQRKVTIFPNIQSLASLEGFIIIEGGFALLSAIAEYVDMILIHQSLSLRAKQLSQQEQGLTQNLDFKYLHCCTFGCTFGDDLGIWLC